MQDPRSLDPGRPLAVFFLSGWWSGAGILELVIMLAFMSPPASVHHMPTASSMSLAILPSTPMAHTSSHQNPAAPKRPKLSLNTANVPSIFGKKSTSLRLDTLSTTSPTSRNTFSNATFDPQGNPGVRAQNSPSTTVATAILQDLQEYRHSPVEIAALNDSASSASTIESSNEPPYSLSYCTKSILSNGPIPRSFPPRTSFGQPKPMMFPATKKVAFRTPLEEVVTTTKYTMRHIDIESSTSTISTLELSPAKEGKAQTSDSATEEGRKSSKSVVSVTKKPPSEAQTGDKRESSDEEEDSDTTAVTPIAGRRKRSRRWVWTLPHVPSTMDHTAEASRKRTASA